MRTCGRFLTEADRQSANALGSPQLDRRKCSHRDPADHTNTRILQEMLSGISLALALGT